MGLCINTYVPINQIDKNVPNFNILKTIVTIIFNKCLYLLYYTFLSYMNKMHKYVNGNKLKYLGILQILLYGL